MRDTQTLRSCSFGMGVCWGLSWELSGSTNEEHSVDEGEGGKGTSSVLSGCLEVDMECCGDVGERLRKEVVSLIPETRKRAVSSNLFSSSGGREKRL